jgi:hypothetical protein
VPVDSDECCEALPIRCERSNYPPVITPGEIKLDTTVASCTNCCKYEPDTCPGNDGNPPEIVCDAASPSFFEHASISLDPRVVSHQSELTVAIAQWLGVLQGDRWITGTPCNISAPKCKAFARVTWVKYEADRKITVQLAWRLHGKWGTVGPPPYTCLLYPCPLAGKQWIAGPGACGGGECTGVAVVWLDQGCEEPSEIECPPREPC